MTIQEFSTAIAFIMKDDTEGLTIKNLFQVVSEGFGTFEWHNIPVPIDTDKIIEELIEHKENGTFWKEDE